MRIFNCATFALCVLSIALPARAAETVLFDGHTIAGVVHDDHGAGKTLSLAADLLSRDLTALSGQTPGACTKVCIVVGLYDSSIIRKFAKIGNLDLSDLKGQWEVYRRAVVKTGDKTYVLIAGSDRRGAVFGTVDLSRQLGVSPWEWWADVTPRRHDRLVIDDATVTSKSPSVKYRGIFINDEDWGLEPWAAKTFDPKTGNIGPKTYAKVFELMWRLKANTLWPAMHSVSTPFYGNPGNAPLAADYAVIVGTSHAEPMMRNNLREWDESKKGPFDFTRNKAAILDYWRQRVDQVKGYDNIYTVGLRGIHDGPMQGASTMEERKAILQNVIGLQRDILSQVYKKPASEVPQVYVAYHELQEAYDAGLKVPDDVTLMWADDNYGYIRRFGDAAEQTRAGGSGVYYHLSYWGRPHDYLWLGTTHPALIHEEMGRAWDLNARRIWITNSGDIKPIEYLTQYFLDLAFDADTFKETPREHLKGFMAETFGPEHADELAGLMLRYYDLAFARRPEFMGFGQTEWVTQNRHTDFVQSDGEEAQSRIKAYQDIQAEAEAIAADIPADRRDAFYELVLYPARASAELNTRILKLDLADLYAGQQRASANAYVDQAKAAHDGLVRDTAAFNALQNGKWQGMMDMQPRRLPVFDEPVWPHWTDSKKDGCDTALFGQWFNDHNTLPFVEGRPETRTLTLYGYRTTGQTWKLSQGAQGFALSQTSGTLDAGNAYEQRLTLHYDGRESSGDHTLSLDCGGQSLPVYVRVLPALPQATAVEDNRIVTLPAAAIDPGTDWQKIDGLGSTGAVLRARLNLAGQGAPAVYSFATSTEVGGTLKVIALPTHPLDPAKGVRVGVSLDGAPMQVLDLSTLGRSDAWRQNVLTNTAVAALPLRLLKAGSHELKVYPLDPGVTLDRIEIDLDRAPGHYTAMEAQP
ncbi:glycosyl hydrolase 115 family protein [Asticcacaulis solisilvae]|uniref:glycosyl hydrolase 115 family protein n=1 Tax=Asticcacaulis solisilvae TaxID=1217274 RepID=UPI003FD70F56